MFKLNEKYDVNKSNLKTDHVRYSPSELSTINAAISQKYIISSREVSVFLLNIYLHINFDVVHAATNIRYADGNDIRLVNLGPIALFSNYKLTTGSGKLSRDIIHAHIVSLMFKLKPSAKDSNDLSFEFDRDRNRRQRELTINKNRKGKYHLRIYLKDDFGFAEHQEEYTYGLGYKLTLPKNTDNSVLNKADATNLAKIKFIATEWYVPH